MQKGVIIEHVVVRRKRMFLAFSWEIRKNQILVGGGDVFVRREVLVEKVHAALGTKERVRLPVSWEALVGGQKLVPSWGIGGRVV